MSASFDPYHVWLGIPPYDQPPNHYRLLGLEAFEPNQDVISNAADRQMAHVRSVATGKRAQAAQRLLNEISQAKTVLLNAPRKAAYDTRLRAEHRNYDLQNNPPVSGDLADLQQQEDFRAKVLLTDASRAANADADARSDQQQYYLFAIGAAVVILIAAAIAVPMIVGASDETASVDPLASDSGIGTKQDPVASNPEKGNALKGNASSPNTAQPPGASSPETQPSDSQTPDSQTPAATSGIRTAANSGGQLPAGIGGIQVEKPAAGKTPPGLGGFNPGLPLGNAGGSGGLTKGGFGGAAKTPGAANPGSGKATVSTPKQGNPRNNILDDYAKARGKQGRYDGAQATVSQPQRQSKAPVPTEQATAAKEQEIRAVYAKEFSHTRTAAERAKLAGFLFAQIKTVESEPETKYALLKMTIEFAAGSGQVDLAKKALKQMELFFDVDAVEQRRAMILQMGERRSLSAENRRTMVNMAIDNYYKLKALRRFDDALEIAKAARTQAIESRNKDLRLSAQKILNEANGVKQMHKSHDAGLRKLATDAEDTKANLDVGKYLCLVKDQWDQGLKHLVKARPPAVAEAARLEQASPADTESMIAAGDAWKKASDLKGHQAFQDRAMYWYEKALPEVKGLTQQSLLRKIRAVRDAK